MQGHGVKSRTAMNKIFIFYMICSGVMGLSSCSLNLDQSKIPLGLYETDVSTNCKNMKSSYEFTHDGIILKQGERTISGTLINRYKKKSFFKPNIVAEYVVDPNMLGDKTIDSMKLYFELKPEESKNYITQDIYMLATQANKETKLKLVKPGRIFLCPNR